MPSTSKRSPRISIACLVLLSGVPIAALLALPLGEVAEAVVHATLGVGFILIALGLSDFELPALVTLLARLATGGLAIVFLLQGVSDVVPSLRLAHFVYDLLGQRLEKFLGYGFVLWSLVLLLFDCRGGTKLLGTFVLAVVLGVEFYSIYMAHVGHPVTGFLKLCYVLLFVWLLLESRKQKANGARR